MRHRNVPEHTAVDGGEGGDRVAPTLGMGLLVSVICLSSVWACRPGGESRPHSQAPSAPARGDRVVVEPRAAEFFEGRVLSVNAERFRVEPVAGGEPLSVSRADVYALAAEREPLKPGQLAICKKGALWVGCRVERAPGDHFEVVTLDGANASVPRASALAPSASTELNLKQAFARSAQRLEFERGAERASVPVSPPSFVPSLHARVLVRRAGGWHSGVIQELHDRTAYVAFAPDGVREQISRTQLMPEPPYPTQPVRGDFVLVRPASPAEPWRTLRVLGATDREFRVGGPGSDERVVSVRDLVPLGAPPSASPSASN
jgi:hypothetical protein